MPNESDGRRDAILATIRRLGVDVSADDVAKHFPETPRRTLQRDLLRLVEAGRLTVTGRARNQRYRSVIDRHEWQTDGGLEVAALVRRPLHEREPVGYARKFLESYRPNVDHYLALPARTRLHELGRSPGDERPAGTFAREIMDRLLIDLSWASSRLEGNTYSRLDTQNLIAFGQLASGKDAREAQMILNHKAAIEMLIEDAATIGFNRYTLQNLHALLADGLLSDPGATGRIRRIPVSISGTVYQPTGIPQRIEEAFDRFLNVAAAIRDPFEQAFFALVHIPYLQPFEDVNKRVSRLASNIPLIRSNLAPLSFVDTPEDAYVEGILGVYELQRVDLLRDLFVWAYERSCQRYTVLKDALPAPDPVRLRHRAVLAELVRDTVRDDDPIEPGRLRGRARPLVPAEDLDAVVAMAVNELHQLHEGNIVRFGLRLSDLRAWSVRPR